MAGKVLGPRVMFAEPFNAVIEPATVCACTEGVMRTSSRMDSARSTRLAVLRALRFNTTVLGKPVYLTTPLLHFALT